MLAVFRKKVICLVIPYVNKLLHFTVSAVTGRNKRFAVGLSRPVLVLWVAGNLNSSSVFAKLVHETTVRDELVL